MLPAAPAGGAIGEAVGEVIGAIVPGCVGTGLLIGGRRRAVGRLVSSELLDEFDASLVLALDETVPVGVVVSLEVCALELASLAPVP
ncbi:MAG: hypothetical protein JWM03_718 [Rhodocyclales bacterium]|nr:hypothetical protein [Rhodocyclales bacterium]